MANYLVFVNKLFGMRAHFCLVCALMEVKNDAKMIWKYIFLNVNKHCWVSLQSLILIFSRKLTFHYLNLKIIENFSLVQNRMDFDIVFLLSIVVLFRMHLCELRCLFRHVL